MNKRYRILLQGFLEDVETFRIRMVGMGVSPAIVEKIIQKAPVILKEDLTLAAARTYANAIQNAGGNVKVQEHGLFHAHGNRERPYRIKPFESFIMCPQCGYKQLKKRVCEKCGFYFPKDGGKPVGMRL